MMVGLEFVVRKYRHWHLAVGLIGNALFLIGSILFLPTFAPWQTFAIYLFIIGSSLMLLSSLGEFAKSTYEKRQSDSERPRA